MKTVLIVDDEKNFLLSLKSNLAAYANDFEVVTSENGAKAIAALSSTPIDFVVTDLNMPVLDGFELLAHMSRHHPKMPVIVMSATVTTDIAERLDRFGVTQFVEKPFKAQDLAYLICNELKFGSSGALHGITLPSFLHLIEASKKTCTLTVATDGESGQLYLRKGELVDAESGPLSGLEAAYHMISWDHAEIDIAQRCGRRIKTIHGAMNSILLEGCRLKDEKTRWISERTAALSDTILVPIAEKDLPAIKKKENSMALEKQLQGLKEIKGFKAAGIMNYTGEMLATESTDPNIDLALVGATFNDIFRSAHEASQKIGLESCKETVISTPKGIVVMRCSGVDEKVHFHVISIMAQDGNQALMKMQVEKMIPAVMEELT